MVGRHRELLSDPKIRNWWEEMSLRSRLSADQYLRQLGLLLERIGENPRSVLVLARKNPDKLRNLLIKDAARLKSEGKLDSYTVKFSIDLKSYLRFNGLKFDGFPRLRPMAGASLIHEIVPTPEELGRVLDRLSLRGRVIALFMAHAGVRPGVLGAYQGAAGLTLGDLPDLKLGQKPSFSEIPFVVRVPGAISKMRTLYTTFGTSQLASTLLAYLAERQESGENLSLASPAIAARALRGAARQKRENAEHHTEFVSTTKLMVEISKALKATAPEGVTWRPYVLRSYCSTRLMLAEGAGKMTRDLREAMLGHDTGVSGRYNVGKTWGPSLLTDARAAYARAEPYLLTGPERKDATANVNRFLKILLKEKGGVPESKLSKMDLSSMSDEEIVALLRGKSTPKEVEPVKVRKQKVVALEAVPKLVDEGWEFVQSLNGTLAVMWMPGGQ